MKSDPLESSLRALGQESLPSCPDYLAADVWREISRRRTTSRWAVFPTIQDWHELFSRPRLAIAALACALIIGTVPAVITTRNENTRQIARRSIHFDVFSSDVPGGLGAPLLSPPSALSSS